MGEEPCLSFLPLSHAYEHTAGQFFPISIGAQIYYAEGPETLLRDMGAARPTIMTAVPRLFEVIRDRILRELRRTGGVAAIDLGTRRREDRLAWYHWPADRVLDLLVRRKVARRFGSRLKALISGGAPLPGEVGMFFAALGLRLLQGYGRSAWKTRLGRACPTTSRYRKARRRSTCRTGVWTKVTLPHMTWQLTHRADYSETPHGYRDAKQDHACH